MNNACSQLLLHSCSIVLGQYTETLKYKKKNPFFHKSIFLQIWFKFLHLVLSLTVRQWQIDSLNMYDLVQFVKKQV